jgi:hypothetical protein
MASAAAMATRVRVNCDCDDISNSPFGPLGVGCGPMPSPIQGACQSRKTAKNCKKQARLVEFPTQELASNPKARSGTFATPDASGPNAIDKEFVHMIGKLVGALLGKRIAGGNQGAKGALLGYGAAALARRSVPTLAAVALGGWAFNKWRDKRRARASYPSDSAPSSPA